MKCKKCNITLNDGVGFCPFCGEKAEPDNTTGWAYDSQPPAPNKSKKAVIILGIVLGVVVVALIFVLLYVFLFMSADKVEEEISLPVEIEQEITEPVVQEEEPEPVVQEEEPEPELVPEQAVETEEVPIEEDIPVDEEVYEPEPVVEEIPFEEETNKRLIIANDGLRLREGPGVDTKKIGLIPDGSIIHVESEFNGWAYTCYNGVYGWCSCDYLFYPSEYELIPMYNAKVIAEDGVFLVTDKYVGSRNALTIIPDKEVVTVYEVRGDNAFIQYRNIYGWYPVKNLSVR